MEYKVKDQGPYQLHMIKTNHFKSTVIKVAFRSPVKKEEITKRSILSSILTDSCAKYKTRKELAVKIQELYAPSITTYTERLGNYSNTYFTLTCLNEKYTEESMIEESIKVLHELLFNPKISHHAFDEETLKIIKKKKEASIKSLKEDPKKYALVRMLENLEPNAPFAYRSFGYLEDLEAINAENLCDYYEEFMRCNMVDIFVIGEIDFDQMEELIKKYFPFVTIKKQRIDTIYQTNKIASLTRNMIEKEDLKQSKLAIGCRLIDLSEQERNYALTLYSIILGGGTDSKFFQNIREKNSLAYYINSGLLKLDNLLIIQAGISKQNYKKTIKLIKEQMQEMKKGDFDEEDIEKAKQLYLTSLDEIEDAPNLIIDSYYAKELLGIDDIETRKQKIMEVKKDEIITVAKKVKMDLIYFLEGGIEDEED